MNDLYGLHTHTPVYIHTYIIRTHMHRNIFGFFFLSARNSFSYIDYSGGVLTESSRCRRCRLCSKRYYIHTKKHVYTPALLNANTPPPRPAPPGILRVYALSINIYLRADRRRLSAHTRRRRVCRRANNAFRAICTRRTESIGGRRDPDKQKTNDSDSENRVVETTA